MDEFRSKADHEVDGVLHGVLAGECEESGTQETSKPSNNPPAAPGEVQDYEAHNRAGGGDASATDGAWNPAVGLH